VKKNFVFFSLFFSGIFQSGLPENDYNLISALRSGARLFGLGVSDYRPMDARPVVCGTVSEVMGERCSKGRDFPLTFLVFLEDMSRGEVRLTSWDNYFGLEVYQERNAAGVFVGLRMREEYGAEVLGRMHDFSGVGSYMQQKLAMGVVFVHISVRGEFCV
jgi:hypothetical protein